MKNKRIYEGLIPSLLPHQELTPKNCFSKKYLIELIIFFYDLSKLQNYYVMKQL